MTFTSCTGWIGNKEEGMKYFVKLVRPYLIWSIVIVIIPLLLIVLYSVTTGGNDLINIQFTLDN